MDNTPLVEKKLVHRSRMAIRWGDMDAFGHVNNTVYFRYIEQARIEWMESLGGNLAGEQGPVLVNAQCTFLSQLTYPGEIEVTCYTGVSGRSSIETMYEIRRTDTPDMLVAEGTAKVVWIDFKLGKSTPLPDLLR
ncbi:acyl-CoA thioesterase [Glaciimonas soli]|uniref:Acyl-CoA thioesterase n=1 Tax=Glaciimonas soli TaxID=2590999 RepID=A0A843YJP0_9BURK|nr:thioesterase family protein [Glaciimonas soli]MQQ99189.1 acyl-CoA thioesterase [Glaciimonas soli]